jgi:hypothetical protein
MMLIRMTGVGPQIVALLAAGVAAAGGLLAADSDGRVGFAPPTALVIDAAEARDGRDLVDPRLSAVDADVRLPRTTAEARTNLRYFAAQDHRVVVVGPRAGAAADAAGVPVVHAPDLAAGLAAVAR